MPLRHHNCKPIEGKRPDRSKTQTGRGGERCSDESTIQRVPGARTTVPIKVWRFSMSQIEFNAAKETPRVVIAIVATDEVKNIVGCLKSLGSSSYREFRVIVNENG